MSPVKRLRQQTKQPQHVSYIISVCKGIALKFNCEVDGRIAIKDKETGKVWR